MIFEENEAARIKSEYDRDGYVRVPGFLDPTSLKELLKNLDRYIAEIVPDLPNSDVYYEAKDRSNAIRQLIRMSKHDDYFARMMHDSEFTRLAELLLGRSTASRNMQFFNKPAKIGAATPPHQDGHYWMIDPCEGLTMWLALEPVDEENGCVRYTTGSHRKGFRPHGRTDTLGFSQGITDFPNDDDRTNEVVMRAQPGDLLVHEAKTVHWADGNTSETRDRKAMGLVYLSDRARENKDAQAAYQKTLKVDLEVAGKI